MNTAKKFLALALTAYAAKQFEEAGCLFAQAAECSDVTKLTDALLQPVTDHLPENQDPITADNQQQLASDGDTDADEWGDEDETPEPPETEETAPSTEDSEEELDEGDEVEDEGDEGDHEFRASSESSDSTNPNSIRRRVTSMYQIGKILAASMEATSADDSEQEETSESESEDESLEPDPDLPGEQLVPVSFSSVTVKKGLAVNSPVKLKQ
jgi:hypothetical protein